VQDVVPSHVAEAPSPEHPARAAEPARLTPRRAAEKTRAKR